MNFPGQLSANCPQHRNYVSTPMEKCVTHNGSGDDENATCMSARKNLQSWISSMSPDPKYFARTWHTSDNVVLWCFYSVRFCENLSAEMSILFDLRRVLRWRHLMQTSNGWTFSCEMWSLRPWNLATQRKVDKEDDEERKKISSELFKCIGPF